MSFLARRILYFAARYTKSHEWVTFNPTTKTAKIGITNYAQQQLGEIVHVELPKPKKWCQAGESIIVIESVKIAADVYTPFAGQVIRINEDLHTNPNLINDDAQKTWIAELSYVSEPEGLLSKEDYAKIVS